MNDYFLGFIIVGSIFLGVTILVFTVANYNGFFEDDIMNCSGTLRQFINGTYYCHGMEG